MSEFLKGGEDREPTEEELLNLKYKDFSDYRWGMERDANEAAVAGDRQKAIEISNKLYTVEAKRERTLGLPLEILRYEILLRYDHPDWEAGLYRRQGEEREIDPEKEREFLEEDLSYLKKWQQGQLPENWQDEFRGRLSFGALFGHGARKYGELIRMRVEKLENPDIEKEIIMFCDEMFMSHYTQFCQEREITTEKIQEIADEIGLAEMVSGESTSSKEVE